jgi:hypothetical protein
MKSETDTTKQINLHEDCPQKHPILQQLLKFVSALHTEFTPVQNQQNTNKELFCPAIGLKDEFVIKADALHSTAGLARSIVFFNWRNYA